MCHQPNTLFWTFSSHFILFFFVLPSAEQKSTLTLLILWYLHFHRSLPLTRTWIINLKWVFGELNENFVHCSHLLSRQWWREWVSWGQWKGSNNNDYKTHSMILLSIIYLRIKEAHNWDLDVWGFSKDISWQIQSNSVRETLKVNFYLFTVVSKSIFKRIKVVIKVEFH